MGRWGLGVTEREAGELARGLAPKVMFLIPRPFSHIDDQRDLSMLCVLKVRSQFGERIWRSCKGRGVDH